MTYKVALNDGARRGMAELSSGQRRAVHDAMNGPLAQRPLGVGTPAGRAGPGALRKLVLDHANLSIGYRVFEDRVVVEVVWLIAGP